MNDVVIADLQISNISDTELEKAFHVVVAEHKDAVSSIKLSMEDADYAYRKYLNEDYEPTEDDAKTDRAILNKAEKNIAEKYASLKAAYEKPLMVFESNIKVIRNTIKEASGVVDSAVKIYKTKFEQKKRVEIDALFAKKSFSLVPLERIFNPKWLNKGTKINEVEKELDKSIAEIYGNIKILEQIPEYGLTVKALYLDTLDMSAAMRQIESLKEKAILLAKEKAEREQRELKETCAQNQKALKKEWHETRRLEEIDQSLNDTLGIPEVEVKEEARKKESEIIEYTLRFRGTEKQLFALRQWMTSNGIAYEKVA